MKPENDPPDAASLRARAEAAFLETTAPSPESLAALSPEATERMLHELRVHQIELEMQNEELRRSQLELEASKSRYFNLYDLAPVGYATVAENGLIIEANLTLATLLGVARSALVGKRFSQFILQEDADTFYLGRKQVFAASATSAVPDAPSHSCELHLNRNGGPPIFVSLALSAALSESGEWALRVVVTDLSARRAREVVDRLEAKTQMEILNAIPAHVALVDPEGVIQVTNESWRRFATANLLQGPEFSLGQNYLKVCESAIGPCSEEAKDAAVGIRRVLRGEAGEFTIEYPCHSPTEQRWFRLMATPLHEGIGGGAVVMHLNITARKLAEVKLAQAAEMLERTGELAKIGGWSVDLPTMKLTWSRETFRISELETLEEPALEDAINFYAPEARPMIAAAVQAAIATGTPYDLELPLITAKGNHRWVQSQGFAERKDGKVVRIFGTFQDITARREAEAALRESEVKLERTLDGAHIGHWALDLVTQAAHRSLQHDQIFGYEELLPEWTYEKFLTHVLPEDRAEVDRSFHAGVAAKTEWGFECRITRRDGAKRWIWAHGNVLTNALGEAGQMFGVVRDITASKEAEASLRASESRVRFLVSAANVGLWDWDLATGSLYFSPEWKGQLGYADHELPSRFEEWESRLHPEDRAATFAAVAEFQAGSRLAYDVEFRLRHRDGSWRWILTQAEIARDASGRAVRMTGSHIDITARKEAEEARRASEARARAVIDASPVAMALNDSDGCITFLNPAFTATFGYALSDIPTLADWWPKAYPDPAYRQQVAERWQAELGRAAQTGTAFTPLELSIRCKDGTDRFVMASAAPLGETFADIHLVVLHDITESKRAEARLRASQKDNVDLRAALDQHAIVAVTDARGRIAFVNDKFCHISQYSREELLGQDHRMINSGQHPREFFRKIWATIQSGRVWQGGICNRAKDGTLYWVDTTIVPFLDKHGAIDRYLAIRKDITERWKAEVALRESAMQLSLVIRGGDIGYWDWNFPTNELVVNDRWLTMLGLDSECRPASMELWNSRVHPDDAHKLVRLVEEVILNPIGFDGEVEIRVRHTAGHYVWILDKFSVVERAADGSPLRVVGTHLDITARKEAEFELRESHERFRQLAENIQEVFWISDTAKKQILYISPAYEKIWGRTCAQLYQDPHSWLEAIHPDDRARILHAAQTKQVLGLYNETYRIQRPDGVMRWIHDQAFPVAGPTMEVQRIVGTAEDITERRQLEEQFRHSQKMQAVGTLAAGIAHDFNNVLAAILGNTELALKDTAPEHPARESLDEIKIASARAKGLVQQILAFSSRQPIERCPMALGPLVKEAARLLRATIPTAVQLVTLVEAEVPPVLADATQVHQVLINLCTNAWHALGDQPGRIEVKLRSVTLDAAAASQIVGVGPGRFACLSVSDNGQGMDAATIERIFDPFFTTKEQGKGTGLGLSVVHGIIKGYQGAIQVASEPGQGTTVTLYIPATASALGVSALGVSASSSRRGENQRIIYLDDDESLLCTATRMMERLGYHVTGFSRAADAVKAFRDNPGQFDLAITDLNVPSTTGLKVAIELLKVRADLPVVLMSGSIDEGVQRAAREAGIRGILCKPFTMEEFSEVIHRLATNIQQL